MEMGGSGILPRANRPDLKSLQPSCLRLLCTLAVFLELCPTFPQGGGSFPPTPLKISHDRKSNSMPEGETMYYHKNLDNNDWDKIYKHNLETTSTVQLLNEINPIKSLLSNDVTQSSHVDNAGDKVFETSQSRPFLLKTFTTFNDKSQVKERQILTSEEPSSAHLKQVDMNANTVVSTGSNDANLLETSEMNNNNTGIESNVNLDLENEQNKYYFHDDYENARLDVRNERSDITSNNNNANDAANDDNDDGDGENNTKTPFSSDKNPPNNNNNVMNIDKLDIAPIANDKVLNEINFKIENDVTGKNSGHKVDDITFDAADSLHDIIENKSVLIDSDGGNLIDIGDTLTTASVLHDIGHRLDNATFQNSVLVQKGLVDESNDDDDDDVDSDNDSKDDQFDHEQKTKIPQIHEIQNNNQDVQYEKTSKEENIISISNKIKTTISSHSSLKTSLSEPSSDFMSKPPQSSNNKSSFIPEVAGIKRINSSLISDYKKNSGNTSLDNTEFTDTRTKQNNRRFRRDSAEEIHRTTDFKGLDFSENGTARRLPQAIIIGVKKGGTRALLEFLRIHPNVQAAGPEVHFFDKNYHKGLEWYRNQMPPTHPGQLTLEKTPSYFISRVVPARIHAMNPNIRLVLVVRDPVTRAISDYAQALDKRPSMPSFAQMALKLNSSSEITQLTPVSTSWGAIKIGLYWRHLEKWLKYFPLNQFHFVHGERLIRDPAAEMSLVQDFLGLERFVTHKDFYFDKDKGFPCLRHNSIEINASYPETGFNKIEIKTKPAENNQESNLKSNDNRTSRKINDTKNPGARKRPSGRRKKRELLSHCLGKTKGRRHPDIDNVVLNKLREFYRPHNEKFYRLCGINFAWP